MIPSEIVSFSLNSNVNQTSLVQFGIQDSSLFVGEIEKIDLNKRNSQWWTFKIKGFGYGATDIFESGMNYAIIDSGTSFITVPLTDYNNFKQQVINANSGLNWGVTASSSLITASARILHVQQLLPCCSRLLSDWPTLPSPYRRQRMQ